VSNKIKRLKHSKHESFVFDAVGFAQLLTRRRLQLGLTTRQLAERANISQPYVVALERSRNGVNTKKASAMGPSPTVDMIARLATALRMSANELFSQAVRPAGKHVLLFMEDDMMTSLERARTASRRNATSSATLTDRTPQEWLCAGGPTDHDTRESHNCLSINLHRDINNAYKPKAIAASLSNELSRHQANILGSDVGIVFDETSSQMSHVNNPMSIVEFEHDWKQVVSDATQAVGAYAAWNICVYRIDNLLRLNNPAEVAQDLLRSHDNVWSARNKSITTGDTAAKRLLTLMRPTNVSAKRWSAHINTFVQELQLSA